MINKKEDESYNKEKRSELQTFSVPLKLKEVNENITINSFNHSLNISKDEAINKAVKFHVQGNIKKAEELYQYCINRKFYDPQVFSNYAIILRSYGQLKKAEILINKAIELQPNFALSHYNKALILKELGNYKEAIECFNLAFKLEPRNKKYYTSSGLQPSNLYRESLTKKTNLVHSIENFDWHKSEILLKKIFQETPKAAEENIKEYIKLWCNSCERLIQQEFLDKLLPIFINLLIISERNVNINNLRKKIFENFKINLLLKLVDNRDKMLLILSYCEHKSFLNEYHEIEGLLSQNILQAETLIKNKSSEDIGWLITRRSLALFKKSNLAKNNLSILINNLLK